MAASLMPVQPVAGVRACASTDASRRRSSSSSSWWSPLFGWSSEPDYIDSENNEKNKKNNSLSASTSSSDAVTAARSRVSTGSFTDEKARKLRMLTTETESFHDAMYHSAIASRLASDFSDRSNL